jgi:hypothetical protein
MIEIQEQFQKIWGNGRWASQEGYPLSGSGSSLAYTENLRKVLPEVIKRHKIKTVFDAPCGDWTWMSQTDLGKVRYVGADIVPEIVIGLRKAYPHSKFIHIDLTKGRLPPFDLWLCRFCLNHLSTPDIVRVFRRLLKSEVRFVMFTSHPGATFRNVKTGGFRMIDFRAQPFAFGEPIEIIEDWMDGFPRCQMLMWKLTDIRNQVRRFDGRR